MLVEILVTSGVCVYVHVIISTFVFLLLAEIVVFPMLPLSFSPRLSNRLLPTTMAGLCISSFSFRSTFSASGDFLHPGKLFSASLCLFPLFPEN